jgi:MurNAc alpha-1-phosphate uridylyltransferase
VTTAPHAAPKTAMVLAAGLGTRMRPLTDDRPKALVEVGGRPLIDHMLDRLAAAGVTKAVVNVHAFADRLEAHLAARTAAPRIVISDERGELLETGGGLKKAAPLLGDDPVFVANIDAVWTEDHAPALGALASAYDPATMDACLLLAPLERTLGFDGPGDLILDGDRARFRGEAMTAPFAFAGVHITKPSVVARQPDGPFSLSKLWRVMAGEGRLGAVVLNGFWMHVGDPQAREAAQARLSGRS